MAKNDRANFGSKLGVILASAAVSYTHLDVYKRQDLRHDVIATGEAGLIILFLSFF